MTLSAAATETLAELDAGRHFNVFHTVSRELIDAGMAFDGWGRLEITEEGRRAARGLKQWARFLVDDPNISNMGDMNEPRPALSELEIAAMCGGENAGKLVEVAPEQLKTVQSREQLLNPGILPDLENRRRDQVWSRARALRAAGVANGSAGTWVDPKWVAAFLEAYEADDV
jgi:hypothetical protein